MLDTSAFLTMVPGQSTRRDNTCLGFRPHSCPARTIKSGWPWRGLAGARKLHVLTIRWAVALLDALFGNSPYLAETALQNPTFMTDLWRDGPDAVVTRLAAELAEARAAARDGAKPDAVAATLRRLKRQQALAIAVADIAGVWPLEKITGALSAFADGCLDALTDAILLQLERDGQLAIGGNPEAAAFTVLGMGKLGADELNYSSDIDLILLYDRDAPALGNNDQVPRHFVRAARLLVQLMSESSVDGYIFRTDLRLRPDPGSTPLAMSVQAAELYYESVGQNWERAAMIKAHPVAGNRAVGAAFLAELTPYIWRRHLDFAAIHDIHSIKRQIDAYRGGGTVGVLGHNVKLGRGGIREIEFFAQTQQLIFGGRNPSLRLRGTCETLRALAAAGHVAPQAADELIEAYRFLRRVEHRLQMVDDKQTHTLPDDAAGLAAIATFLGYASRASFENDLLQRLRCVEGHYARLFEEAPSLAGPGGNLVFTGTDDDPGTLETLRTLGFQDPSAAAGIVRKWHHGRFRATRSARARELLTELMPALLKALGETASPDHALLNFDLFLGNLPAGVQLFSLFKANPALVELVAAIMGSAPGLAAHLARRPILLDSVLSQDFYKPLPTARRDGAAICRPCWRGSRTSRTSSMPRGAGPTTGASRSACSSSSASCARPRPVAPIPTSRRPRSPPSAIASRRSSPRTMAAFAASAWRCWGWASSAAARCRRPPIST